MLTISLLLLTVPHRFNSIIQSVEAASPNVVISQVYGGGGNSGATYKNDFIELFNRGTTPVSLTGWSVQYTSSTGITWQVTALSGSIAPGGYYLVQQAAGTGGTVTLPAPNATGSIPMSATAGKVALTNSTTALTGACPAAVDLVGFGGANCFEGSGPTATLSNTTAALRKGNGCTETDSNSADFAVGAPTPRNSSSPLQTCEASNNPPSITPPADPIATVPQDAPPLTVSLSGADDNNVFNWGATAGTGVSSVSVSAGQGTADVTYNVTLQAGFSGTATFTASLSDGVNTPAMTRAVRIAVTPTTADNPPSITAPSNPAATVVQDAAPFTITLSGSDDNSIFNWLGATGAGVSTVAVTAGQGTSSATYTVTLQPGYSGTATFIAKLSDNVNPQVSQAVNVTVTPAPPPPLDHVVISQVYGGGGNSGAAYQNDFVELFNPDTVAHDLSGWTIQYASATGTSWQFQPLGGTIAPGEYYLIKLASGGAVGAAVPDANINGSINMSGTNGKVALVRAGDPLEGCTPTDPAVVDFVGYGTTANCREGATNAPAPSSTNSIFRKNGGFTDTNVNGSDFATGTPNPRRTTPIVELPPTALSSDPRKNGTNAPRDASITVNFTEPVDIENGWFDITCATTGQHNNATIAPGGPNAWIIIPNVNFQADEQCTLTVNKDFVRDSDLDDSAPNTDLLTGNYTATFTVATGAAPAYAPDVHLTMGNPSNATADLDTPNNYLMVKPEFTLSYNRDRATPNWVSWHLADEWVGSLQRVDTFRADPAVPADWYRVTHLDYSGSGFDRGHMVPNADRDPETSTPINQATFLMTNIIPQSPDNNQGPWANMENYLRTLLPANELYIVAGGYGTGGAGSNGFTNTIANGKVAVPAETWKVALVIPKQSGDDVSRVTCGARTIAVIMPNVQGIRTNNSNDWQNYITTVDAVEAKTGYDFFSNLPDAVENCVEAGKDGVNPPGTANQSATVAEDGSVGVTLAAVSQNPDATLTYTIVTPPAHGTLSGAGAQLTYTPAPDYNGTDSFTFRGSDGTRTSNTSTVTVGVTEDNDAPVASDDAKATQEDTPLTFAAGGMIANDSAGPANESGQILTVTAVAAGASTHGMVEFAGGQITYTPAGDYHGLASFAYTVCDNGTTAGSPDAKCATGTIAVTVNAANDAPIASGESYNVKSNGTLSVAASGVLGNDFDVDGPALSAVGVSGPANGASFTLAPDGSFSYIPRAGYVGPDSFTYRAHDGSLPSNPVTVSITVAADLVAEPVAQGGMVSTGSAATPADPAETSVTSPIAGLVVIAETTTTEAPAPPEQQPGGVDAAAVYNFLNTQVNITAPASTPENPLRLVFLLDSSVIPAGQNFNTLQIFRNGVLVQECDPAALAASPQQALPSPCVAGRELAGDDIRLTVLTVAASRWNFGVKKPELNIPPALAPVGGKTVYLGETLTFTAAGSDGDVPAQTLTYRLDGAPAGASISPATGAFSWKPTAAQAGRIHTFKVVVSDGITSAERAVSVGVAYTWSGFLDPVASDGSSAFKLGLSVPVKFRLTGASAGLTDVRARLMIAKVTNGAAGAESDAKPTPVAAGSLFRYDAKRDQYVFNVDTAALQAGTYRLRVDTGDGVERVVNITLLR